ncbi:hypothetical protein M404DRAFT_746418 [Pisolithus tinctorius Marx 270]|uniref:Uncharacterized protein n=1 Tax=Pisolithus tinctorius Marx 270 TaxID=870435 RepID=A0A0C3JG06_PISTI|nr:hypothetical protein M404DRAFT_244801 [Pisolithus tinctorius Marx 270]KIO11999.1 hypothetical protein M404DRAFT_746418 [Pisolithus tinctorius Marx 270]
MVAPFPNWSLMLRMECSRGKVQCEPARRTPVGFTGVSKRNMILIVTDRSLKRRDGSHRASRRLFILEKASCIVMAAPQGESCRLITER